MEIERKWLLRRVPSMKPQTSKWVNQFYVSTEPEIRLRSTRSRDSADDWKYFLTIKGEGLLSREEVEVPIDGKSYLLAWDLCNCKEVHKNFMMYHEGDKDIEVSVILDHPDFIYAEVEFESEDEANSYEFPWPDIVEKEITYDPEYKMKNYWKRINARSDSEEQGANP